MGSAENIEAIAIVSTNAMRTAIMLQVSALHYSAGSRVLEGFQTVDSAHVLHLPTISGLSISLVSIHKFKI